MCNVTQWLYSVFHCVRACMRDRLYVIKYTFNVYCVYSVCLCVLSPDLKSCVYVRACTVCVNISNSSCNCLRFGCIDFIVN